MTEINEPRLLAEWLDAHPGEPPPEGVDAEVVEAVYALRPDLAPAPRVTIDDILAGVTTGPFAQARDAAPDGAPAFGGALGTGWEEDLQLELAEEPVAEEVPVAEDAPEPEPEPEPEAPATAPEVSGSVDEVAIPGGDEPGEATPIVGRSGTDPLVDLPEGATDPGLVPIGQDLLEEHTSPSGRQPAFGVVEAPPPPKPEDTASMMAPPAEPPPSLRSPIVKSPRPAGPLSSAGLPTAQPRMPIEPDRPTTGEQEADDDVTDPVIEDVGGAEVVDLASHPRWSRRRLWATAGTVLAAALALVVFVPSLDSLPGRDLAEAPAIDARSASPVVRSTDRTLGEPPPPAEAEVPLDAPPEVVGNFAPNQRLDAPTRALGQERKKSEGTGSTAFESSLELADEEAARPRSAIPPTAAASGRSQEERGLAGKDDDGGWADDPDEFMGGAPSVASPEPEPAPFDPFDEIEAEEDDMSYREAEPAPSLSAETESSQGDWGQAASRKSTSRSSPRRDSSRSEGLGGYSTTAGGGEIGALQEAAPGSGPEAPPPHELDILRREARPSDYTSGWYLSTPGIGEQTLETIRKVLQEADADTRLDDYTHAAEVAARLVGHADPRVGQDFASRAAVWYLEAGKVDLALDVIARGKDRGSANTPFLARLLYLEGKALERKGKAGWAAESYRAAKALNEARR